MRSLHWDLLIAKLTTGIYASGPLNASRSSGGGGIPGADSAVESAEDWGLRSADPVEDLRRAAANPVPVEDRPDWGRNLKYRNDSDTV
jgi:hypothetical protein